MGGPSGSTTRPLAVAIAGGATVCLLVWAARRRLVNALAYLLQDMQHDLAWQRMPERIILLRHGEAEHNLDDGEILLHDHPNRKPDNLCELTSKGKVQAKAAGRRINQLLGDDAVVSVVVSPFERTKQTLFGAQQTLGGVRIRQLHVDARVREQEFSGGFQDRAQREVHKRDARDVGRFWYRRSGGESSADVFDRASSFWDSVLSARGSPCFDPQHRFDMCDADTSLNNCATSR